MVAFRARVRSSACLHPPRPAGDGRARRCGEPELRSARQRRAGLRDRARPGGAGDALRPPRPEARDQGSRQPRRRPLSEAGAGRRLPRPPRLRRPQLRAPAGSLDQLRATQHRRLQPVDPVEWIRVPDHPRRHKAGDRRPSPAGRVARAAPPRTAGPAERCHADPDRVLRLRLCRPGRAAERDRDPRQPDGVHGGRRQHARHRLLGRRLRLLRTAAEPRRLRRRRDDRAPAVGPQPQGRDDGDLLRRDQPALHRGHRAAEPGRDLAAVGARQHPDDALSGRHPQHRVRGRLGEGTGPRRPAGVGHPGPAVGLQTDPGRRPGLQGKPGAARRGG